MEKNNKSVIRTQRKLLAFPWLNDFYKIIKASLKITEASQKQLITYMDSYISFLKPESVNCATRPNKAFFLAQSIIETLVLFKNINYEFELTQEYLTRLQLILSNYVDLELKGSLRGKETVAEITTRIILTLEGNTKPADNINFMYVFLNMRRLQNGHRDILHHLFMRFLKPKTIQYEFNDYEFLIYLIIFKLWRNIETCLAEKTKVSELAEKFMKPKPTFRKNKLICHCLPPNSLRVNEENAAYYILQNKFNVDRLIRVSHKINSLEHFDGEIIDLDSDEYTDQTISEISWRNVNSVPIKKETVKSAKYIDLTQEASEKLFWLDELSLSARNAKIEKQICETFSETKKVNSTDVILIDDEDHIHLKASADITECSKNLINVKSTKKEDSTQKSEPNIDNPITVGNDNTKSNNKNNDVSNNSKLTEDTSQNILPVSNNIGINTICDNSNSIPIDLNPQKHKENNVESLEIKKINNTEEHLCKSSFLPKKYHKLNKENKKNNQDQRNDDGLREKNCVNCDKIVFSQSCPNKIPNEPLVTNITNSDVIFSVDSNFYPGSNFITASSTMSDVTNEILLNFCEDLDKETDILLNENIDQPITFEFLDDSTIGGYTNNFPELNVGDIVTITTPTTELSPSISPLIEPTEEPLLTHEINTILRSLKDDTIINMAPTTTNDEVQIQNQLQPQLIYTTLPNISPVINTVIENPTTSYIPKAILNISNKEPSGTLQSEQTNNYQLHQGSVPNLQALNILQQSGFNSDSSTNITPITQEGTPTLQTFNLIPTQRPIFVTNLDGLITVPLVQHQQQNVNFNNYALGNNPGTITPQHSQQLIYSCPSLLQNNLQNFNCEPTSISNELRSGNLGYNLPVLQNFQYPQTFQPNQQYITTNTVQPMHTQQQIMYPQLNMQNMVNLGNYHLNSQQLSNYLDSNQMRLQGNQSLIPILPYQPNSQFSTMQENEPE